jgi:rare lipoprotein A
VARTLAFIPLLFVPLIAAAEPPPPQVLEERGKASYYHDKFEGRTTATGETFDQEKLTAASRTLPLGTQVTVTNEANGKSVDVRINDRGPYVGNRIIDLTEKAAEHIDMKEQGVAPVKVEANPAKQPTEKLKRVVKKKAEQKTAPPQRTAAASRKDAAGKTGSASSGSGSD